MRVLRWGVSVAALVGVPLAGCDAVPGDSASAASVRDSASVRIVTSAGPDRPLVTREVLRIGAIEAEPEYLFDAIRSVAVAADGSIWVSDSDPAIRRYSAEGEYLNSAGGEGEGPGESSRGYGNVWVGNGVVLVDGYSPPTLQRFGFGGDFRGARSQIRSDGPPHFPLGSSSVGWYLRSETIPTDEGDRVRSRWTVWHGDALGGPVDSILVLPGQPRVRRRPRSWSSGSYFDGFPSLGAAGDHVYYSDALEYEVRIFGRDGGLGTVTFPPEFAPLDVTGDRIYGTVTDEFDVQYVIAYEISP